MSAFECYPTSPKISRGAGRQSLREADPTAKRVKHLPKCQHSLSFRFYLPTACSDRIVLPRLIIRTRRPGDIDVDCHLPCPRPSSGCVPSLTPVLHESPFTLISRASSVWPFTSLCGGRSMKMAIFCHLLPICRHKCCVLRYVRVQNMFFGFASLAVTSNGAYIVYQTADETFTCLRQPLPLWWRQTSASATLAPSRNGDVAGLDHEQFSTGVALDREEVHYEKASTDCDHSIRWMAATLAAVYSICLSRYHAHRYLSITNVKRQ